MKTLRCFYVSQVVLALCVTGFSHAQSKRPKASDCDSFTVPHVTAGFTVSDITYRVISLYGQGFADRVVSLPATGTLTFLASSDPAIWKWVVSARMDGKPPIESVAGEYRDAGRTQCVAGQCSVMTDASSPFFNPTMWGKPTGELVIGKMWKVELSKPWELGPAGTQTVTVLSVDKQDGIVVLKREGHGVGPYEGKHDSTTIKMNGQSVLVTTKYGDAHWVGQAVFQRGVTMSDELLTVTPVELLTPESGVIHAEERQYMSLLQHPEPIHNTVVQP